MKIIPTRVAEVKLDDQGVVHFVFTKSMEVTLQDAKELFRARMDLGHPDPKHPILLDVRQNPKPNREARFYSKKKEVIEATRAMAIVTGSFTSQVLGNFFMGFIKGDFPVRMFTDVDSAVEWLKSKE